MANMNSTVRHLLLQRNDRETIPFLSVHQAYATLLHQLDALQAKCDASERELATLRTQLSTNPSKAGTAAAAAALKNESRLRDKLEQLQEEYNARLKLEATEKAAALENAQMLGKQKDLIAAQEIQLEQQQKDMEKKDMLVNHLQEQVSEAKQATRLAEQQYDGLKQTIRQLQKENDELQKENRSLEQRLVEDKKKLVEEMNTLTDMVGALKREVDMLRTYKAQEEQRKSWFGAGAAFTIKTDSKPVPAGEEGRQFGQFGVVVPSVIKQTITAHGAEGTCLRYDPSGTGLLATASSDSSVKIFDTNHGQTRATFRGSPGCSMIGCDLSSNLVVGAGSDKTCRVWNLRTQRMIHHLVGHAQKITCVRLFGQDKFVLTASSDRSLKVWDISLKTYKQTTTLRHSSTSNCVDVASDSVTAASGHLDGGLRLWNLQSGERIVDMPSVHEAAVTSVQFNPCDNAQILTNAADSCLKVVDVRTGLSIHTLRQNGFQTIHNWSSAAFSPDGKYAIAGSNSTGEIFVWETFNGKFKKKLLGHSSGVCGIDWGRGSQQQVATIDRKGILILWG